MGTSRERPSGSARRELAARDHLRRRRAAVRGRRRGRAPRPAARCCSRCAAWPIRSGSSAIRITGWRSGSWPAVAGLLHGAGCRDVVFIGTVVRPALARIPARLDDAAAAAADHRGCSAAATIICCPASAGCSRSMGFRVVGRPRGRAGDPDAGGRARPRRAARRATAPISRAGSTCCARSGPSTSGRRSVVADNHVLAVEAAEGTDRMLERVAELRRRRPHPHAAGVGVLVKAPKPGQDRRFDLPSIGPRTVEARAARRACRHRGRGRRQRSSPSRTRSSQLADQAQAFRRRRARAERCMTDACLTSPTDRCTLSSWSPARNPATGSGAALMRALRATLAAASRSPASAAPKWRRRARQPVSDRRARDHGLRRDRAASAAILRRIRETADAAIAAQPDVLVIIDSPDFTHRVARRVRAAAPSIPIVDYVSPSVWAWRPGRARAMRALCRSCAGAAAVRAGGARAARRAAVHLCRPSAGRADRRAAAGRRTRRARREADPPVLLVLPGSRRGEIRRHAAMSSARPSTLARGSERGAGRGRAADGAASGRRGRGGDGGMAACGRASSSSRRRSGRRSAPRARRWRNPAPSRSSWRSPACRWSAAYKVSRDRGADRAGVASRCRRSSWPTWCSARMSCRNCCRRTARRRLCRRRCAAAAHRHAGAAAAARGLRAARRDHGDRQQPSPERSARRRDRAGHDALGTATQLDGMRLTLFPPRDRHVVAPRRAGIELARPADLLVRILDHLLPLRDPADRAGDREQHGEHGGREAHRLAA